MKNYRTLTILLVLAILSTFIVYGAGKDIRSTLTSSVLVAPVLTSTDVTSAALAVNDNKGLNLYLYTGTGSYTADLSVDWQVTECDEVAGTYAAVADSDILGAPATVTASGTVLSIATNTIAADYSEICYIGTKKYIKLKCDLIGDHSTATPTVAAFAVQAYPYLEQ